MQYIMQTTKKTYYNRYYQMRESNEWTAVGKRLHGVGQARIDIYQKDKLQFTLMQPNWLTSIIAKMPIIMFFYESPFYFYRNGIKCGHWKPIRNPCLRPGKWDFFFDGATYQLALGPYISFRQAVEGIPYIPHDTLLKNGTKIATYVRDTQVGGYRIEYLNHAVAQPEILLLFGAFLENYLDRDR